MISVKPIGCTSCPLAKKSVGYGHDVGPKDADLLLIGEALGQFEAEQSMPFVGPAGMLLNRALSHVGIVREEVRITNQISCQPPGNWLVGSPWQFGALDKCKQYLNKTIDETNPKVIIALGAVSAKELLGLRNVKASIYDLHGTSALDARTGKYWVVPTIHPSAILQGGWAYYGVLLHDLSVAKDILDNGHVVDSPTLILDPGWATFDAWVNKVLERAQNTPGGLWIAVDIETPGKHKKADEDDWIGNISEIENIDRINFAVDLDEAITVPFDQAHLPSIKKLLESTDLKKVFWNMVFDRTHLTEAGCEVTEPAHDFMWYFHILQSNIRMGLGPVSPYYSSYGPWKHLTDHNKPITSLNSIELNNYKEYSAIDALQTIRCTYGIEGDLKNQGQWDIALRHVRDVDRFALRPAEKEGLLVDGKKLQAFIDDLVVEESTIVTECIRHAPQEIVPYEKTWRTARPATDAEGTLLSGCKEIKITDFIYLCPNCGQDDVTKSHAKTKKCMGTSLEFEERTVTRWAKEGVFNPNSPKQILAYIKFRGHKPGKQKKSKGDSSDVQALEKLVKKHPKDPIYKIIMKLRKVTKMKGTYGIGIQKEIGLDGRLHASITHFPSTLRTSCRKPNLQNMVSKDKREDESNYGKRFRECIVAAPGCKLLELDWRGIEAVQTGWFARDVVYLRLAGLGVHSYLCSHIVGKPADLSWSDEELKRYFKEIKEEYFIEYNKAKRCTHSSAYMITPRGLHLTYPETFPTIKAAKEVQEVFFAVAPKVRQWQLDTVQKADQQGYLGGNDHPYSYKCFSSDTELLTKNGWKNVSKIAREDFVATLDNNCNIEYENPLAIWDYNYSGKMIHARGRSVDQLVTPDHRMWVRRNKKEGFKFILADNCHNTYSFYTGGVRGNSGLGSISIGSDTISAKIWLRFLGIWLADGCATKSGHRYIVDIAQRPGDKADKIRELLNKLPWNIYERLDNQGMIHWIITRKHVWQYLDVLGKAKSKFIPRSILEEASSEELAALIEYFHLGDGSFIGKTKDGGTKALFTTSNQLADDLMEAAFFSGYRATKRWQIATGFTKDIPGSGVWVITLGMQRSSASATWAKIDYTGKVYCVTTKNGRVLCRRNGKASWSGNCWFWDVISYKKVSYAQAQALRHKGQQVKAGKHGTWYHITMGTDAKSAVAFYPQSTAGGNLKEAMLALLDPDSEYYVGDCYYNKTPFRVPIHDSLLFEVPDNKVDYVLERVVTVMRSLIKEQPLPTEWGMGTHLQIDVSAEIGRDWSIMEEIKV